MRLIVILLPVALAAAWIGYEYAPASAARPAVSQPSTPGEVRSISLDGHGLPLARLREVVETQPGSALDAARLERDHLALKRVLTDLGYLAARVDPPVLTFDASGAVYVSFDIDQGALFHVRRVDVVGPGKDYVVVTLAPGDVALASRLDRARSALAEGLAHHGKSADVELTMHTDAAAAAVDVALSSRPQLAHAP